MFVVIFEVQPSAEGYQTYLDTAAALRPRLEAMDGFVSIERFRCLTRDGWILSLSLWRDEAALTAWRVVPEHHHAQTRGRAGIFSDYHLRVGQIVSDDDFIEARRTPERRTAYNDPTARPPRFAGLIRSPDPHAAGEVRYESIVSPGNYADLVAHDAETTAWRWRDSATAIPAPGKRVLLIEIERDYGMFDRREAPQYYPDVRRT